MSVLSAGNGVWRLWSGCGIAITALCLSGCGETKAPAGIVKGKVTFGEKPVSTGTIRFQNAEISLGADLEADGSYEVKTHQRVGLPPGSYQVAVVPRNPLASGEVRLVQGPPSETPSPEFPDIPPKFRDVATSNLSVTVVEGKNPEFNFDLSK